MCDRKGGDLNQERLQSRAQQVKTEDEKNVVEAERQDVRKTQNEILAKHVQ